jgi:tagatose-6-phosphate ketose/aldose isomerase
MSQYENLYTWREIHQQPATWLDTAERAGASRDELLAWLDDAEFFILTGSGSSQYAGECVRPVLERELGRTVRVFGGGAILLEDPAVFSRSRGLMISLARSGDSPESCGAVDLLLESAPELRHLVITCNANGRLATQYRHEERVRVLTLDPRTNDRSLVMTSSFTNMVMAARALGMLNRQQQYADETQRIARAAESILAAGDRIAELARRPFRRVVYLGSGPHFGAAREAALKMLEMTGGRIATLAETFLGLRHGPMTFIDSETLVVCFLSAEPLATAYENDLLKELTRKNIGYAKLFAGEALIADGADLALEYASDAGDANTAVLDVAVGQLLAFHRCLHEGLSPDNPSQGGIISRVVSSFNVYRRAPK